MGPVGTRPPSGYAGRTQVPSRRLGNSNCRQWVFLIVVIQHTPTFVPIELEPCPTASEFILIWAPNRSLRIPPGFDPTALRRLLDVLGVRS